MPRLRRTLLIAYIAATLPLLAIFAGSEYTRFIALETCVHWRSKFSPPHAVFIGDSITAGGRNWGWRLWGNPLAARNLGASGATIFQVQAQARVAASYGPQTVYVLAGTNDLLTGRGTPDEWLADYRGILAAIAECGAKPVVTLVPYTAHAEHSAAIGEFNSKLRELCQEVGAGVVDLNAVVAPDGVLLPEYTTDGVHLSEAAYGAWAGLLPAA